MIETIDVVAVDDKWDGINKPNAYIDFLGQEIRVGDYVLYATTQGNSCKLTLGRVDEFQTENAKGEPYLGYAGFDYSTKPATPLPKPSLWKLKIQPLKDGSYSWRQALPQGGFRKVTLNNLHNVVRCDVSSAQFEEYED